MPTDNLQGPASVIAWAGTLQTVGAVFGLTTGLAAISYVFGFVAINSFLGARGVTLYSAINSEFLAAGLSFWLFVIITGIIFVVHPNQVLPSRIWDEAKSQMEENLARKLREFAAAGRRHTVGFEKAFRVSFLFSFILSFTATYLIRLIFQYGIAFLLIVGLIIYVSTSNFNLLLSVYFYLWIIVVIVTISLLIDFAGQATSRRRIILPLVLLSVWLSAFFYGRGLYPYLPASIGGGASVQVKFVVDLSDKDLVQSILDLKMDSSITPEVQLLLETSDFFVISIRKDRTTHIAQLKRDYVKAVLYPNAL